MSPTQILKRGWRSLLIAGVLLLLYMTSLSQVQAAPVGLSISPAMLELSVQPTKSYEQNLSVTNTSDKPIIVYTTTRDFTSKDDSGTASYVKPVDDSYTISSWVEIGNEVTFQPGETKQLPIRIKVPASVSVGGHYGTIFLQPRVTISGSETEGTSVKTNTLVGMHMLLTVEGDIKKKVVLQDFGISNEDIPSDKGMTFEALVKNSGNVHVAPKGRIEIYDRGGNKLTHIGTLLQSNAQGTIYNEVPVDFLPFNQKSSKALPDQTRRIKEYWDFEDVQDLEGDYVAKYFMEYGDISDKQISQEVSFSIEKEVSFSNYSISSLGTDNSTLVIKADITNTGTVGLHPAALITIKNIFGTVIHEGKVDFDGVMEVGDRRTLDYLWEDVDINTLIYYPEVRIVDAYGNTIDTYRAIGFFFNPVMLMIVLLVLFFLLIGVFSTIRYIHSLRDKPLVTPREKQVKKKVIRKTSATKKK